MAKTTPKLIIYFIVATGIGFFLPFINKTLINIKSLSLVFEQKEDGLAKKVGQIEQVKHGLKGVQDKAQQLKEALRQAQNKIKSLEQEKLSASRELIRMNSDFVRNINQLKAQQEEANSQQNNRIEPLAQKIEELGSSTKNKDQQYNKMMGLFVRLQEKELALSKSNSDFYQKLTGLEQEKVSLESVIVNLENTVEQQNGLIETMKADRQKFNDALQIKVNQFKATDLELQQEKRLKAAQEEKVNKLQAAIDNLKANNDAINKQSQGLSAQLAEKNLEISKLNQEGASSRKEYRDLLAAKENLGKELSYLRQEKELLREKLSGLESLKKTADAQLSENNALLEQGQDSQDRLQEQVVQMTEAAQAKEAQLTKAKADRDSLKEDIQSLGPDLTGLGKDIEALKVSSGEDSLTHKQRVEELKSKVEAYLKPDK